MYWSTTCQRYEWPVCTGQQLVKDTSDGARWARVQIETRRIKRSKFACRATSRSRQRGWLILRSSRWWIQAPMGRMDRGFVCERDIIRVSRRDHPSLSQTVFQWQNMPREREGERGYVSWVLAIKDGSRHFKRCEWNAQQLFRTIQLRTCQRQNARVMITGIIMNELEMGADKWECGKTMPKAIALWWEWWLPQAESQCLFTTRNMLRGDERIKTQQS